MKQFVLKNGQCMILHEAEKSDAAAVVDFFNFISGETDFLSFGLGEYLMTVAEEEKLLEKYASQDNGIFMLAEVDGRMAGIIFFSGGTRPRLKHTGEFGIGIAKDYWGLSMGRIMIEYLIEWAKQTKIIHKINLLVRTDNEKAIHLYKSLGFAIEGTITRDLFINGVFYDGYHMGMPID